MSAIPPGWYKDPADPTTQRWWDGEGWLGDPLPADAVPPDGPPAVRDVAPVVTARPTSPAPAPAGPTHAVPRGPSAPATPTAPPGSAASPVPVLLLPGPGARPVLAMAAPLVAPRPHGLMLAGAGSRFAARVIDVTLVLVLAAIANTWFAIQFWRAFRPVWEWFWATVASGQPADAATMPASASEAGSLLMAMSAVLAAVWFAYEVPATANSGQTVGKRMFGIKVMRLESDERLGFGRSFSRWLRMAWPTPFWFACWGLPAILQFIDCLFVAIDRPLRRALHDRAALTVVVQVPRAGRPETAPTTPTPFEAMIGGRHVDPR